MPCQGPRHRRADFRHCRSGSTDFGQLPSVVHLRSTRRSWVVAPATQDGAARAGDCESSMTLVLHSIALDEAPMSQPLVGRFDERGGTVGRSDNATFTLPDPERMISRVQAQILFRDEGYWIENVSTANSTLHNGRPLSAGMRILLREGDELRIG